MRSDVGKRIVTKSEFVGWNFLVIFWDLSAHGRLEGSFLYEFPVHIL
jgi:hypothetical protein